MLHYFAAAVAAAHKALERECPACHHKQVVAFSKWEKSVPCQKCGEPVPPKKPGTDELHFSACC